MRDTRYQWTYLFGAVCPDRGVGAGLVMPCANTEAMNKHLEEIGKAVTPGAHAALIFDGAGWHDSADLVMPENITPVILPPYSAGTQSRRECLGIFTQEQARQSPLRNLRGYCRSLLRRLEQPHGDAGPHRIHCRKNLGKGVITYGGWYYISRR